MHSTMKRFSLCLSVFLAALPAGAQTDTNALAALAVTNAAPTMMNTNAGARTMSLPDCIQEALQHNFDIQVQRYNPRLALYTLRGAYAGYDPLLNISGQHEWSTLSTTTNGTPLAFNTSDNNSFSSDLGGSLPWGLTYDFAGKIENPYGTTYSGITNVTSTFYKSSDGTIEVDLTQHLLKDFWIDSTRLAIKLDKNKLKSSEQALRQQIINSVTAVENAYYELIYAQENVKVQQEALNLAQTQLDQDNQRVQIGTLAILDVQQDEAQVAQSQANLIAAQYTLVQDQNTLKNLLTDTYSKWHDTDIQPTATLTAPLQSFDLQNSWRKGLTGRPDLLQARLGVENQGIQLKYDRNQLFPTLDLKGTYGFAGEGRQYSDTLGQINTGNQPYYSYGAQLSIPLSNVGARNTYKYDKVSLQQLVLELKQLEQNVMVQIDNAVKQAQSAYQSTEATRQARIYAEAALDAEQKKYAVGKSTTFTVLQLQTALTTARSNEIRALANYNEALANLAAQEGSTLERDKIDIQAK
jgi:outer membrane protein TolC